MSEHNDLVVRAQDYDLRQLASAIRSAMGDHVCDFG